MATRLPVPRPVQRRLWAEAFGYCMNPECEAKLISDADVNLGEMAHIVANADGGDPSFENMILLCKDCHTEIDATRNSSTIPTLRSWKEDREREMRQRFSRNYTSFEELRNDVVPLLERNGGIFDLYGPDGDLESSEARHALWDRFEGELVANNRKLELMLSDSKRLFHRDNWNIITAFLNHAREFVTTRGLPDTPRSALFPRDILSIFGIEESIHEHPVPNLAALENFISRLVSNDSVVSLELESDQSVTYVEGDGIVTMSLLDIPHVQQVFWTGKFFTPRRTDVRTRDLVFMLRWLTRNGFEYRFDDPTRLSELTINDRHHVKFFYSYVFSSSDAQQLREDQIAVNLHMWNKAPVSDDARRYIANAVGTVINQDEFFIYAKQNMR